MALAGQHLRAIPDGLAERLICLHDEIKTEGEMAALSRLAIALYDERTDLLKTFIHSSDGDSPLDHSVSPLGCLPSLVELAQTGGRRVINDLEAVGAAGRKQAARLAEAGYLSSYTMPIRSKDRLFGFLFLNSFRKGFFTPQVVHRLRPYVELIAQIVMRELEMVRMMRAAVRVVRRVSAVRDEETGAHLARMARYARLVAMKLAAPLGFNDEFVEYLFQFAPLHDVGKISIPDYILFKPGKLDDGEFVIMKTHVAKGLEIVDLMAKDFGMASTAYFPLLRNVIAYHHEALDGSGYPFGLGGKDIPLEARIAAVADVFDALTSERPYKHAWSNQEALDLLREQAGSKFDPACVEALLASQQEIADIQARFEATVFD